jgi:hypothetical protein
MRSREVASADAVPSSVPERLPAPFSPLIDERERIDRILNRLDRSEDLAERADLGSELVRSMSRYEDTLERVVWSASSDPNSAELLELAEDLQKLRDVMVVIQKRTQHVDPRNVHVSDSKGFEGALAEVARRVRAILVKEDRQFEQVEATLTSSESRERFTSDIAHAISHASEKPIPAKTAIGRAVANLGVKLDRNFEDVSTPLHPAAEITKA